MEHKKTYNAMELKTTKGSLIIEGPISSEQLAGYEFHQDLVAFRPPNQQHKVPHPHASDEHHGKHCCT